ncbi:hypothetical protein BGZ60DRAFT_535878 [Tricladium varicosporioides]|nr:hypothetical protein BGZ60DRAFT_535878 [Hymenoscyphus varicosporioides]
MAPHAIDGSHTETDDRSIASLDNDLLEPIAIVGFSIGFPQDATSSDALWKIMMEKRTTSTDFPKNRMNVDAIYHPDPNRRGQISVRQSHFLCEDASTFDAAFFSTSSTDATCMDPQQRKLLEYAYKALENAGMPLEIVSGTKTSVYTGSFTTDWSHISYKDGELSDTTTALGTQSSLNANRISWFFNFTGNSANIDTACSSSLVALDLGCQGLRRGDENMSIVAGANLILSPDYMHTLTNMNMLSPDGHCYSFDHRANGYSRGEGIGVLILKRVSDAVRDCNTIRGIIRNTGCNQDGNTSSITLPNKISQEILIQETYKKAGLSMRPTRFFEAHGTGTTVGDPIESKALGSAFRNFRTSEDPLWVGAVKSNIGHLEGASGIAGVIKTLLVLEKGIIPPNTNFEKANPKIDTEFLRIQFPLEAIPWPVHGLRRASVNSFGNSGTNAHVILDDVFHFLREHGLDGLHLTVRDPPAKSTLASSAPLHSLSDRAFASRNTNMQHSNTKLLLFSSHDEAGIKRQVDAYVSYFATLEISPDQWHTYTNNLAFTLSSRRSSLPWKSFAMASTPKDLVNLDKTISIPTKSAQDPNLAFIFTGQGAQWLGMGRELMIFPTFQQSISKSESLLLEMGCLWSLSREIRMSGEKGSSINSPDLSQPMCTAVQIALIDLLSDFNIHPTVVVGHSSGEMAAAYTTKAISATSAMKLAYFRGTLAKYLSTSNDERGDMISVGLSYEEAQLYLGKVTSQCSTYRLTVACINSSKNVTISGDENQIAILKELLDSEKIFNRKLGVNVAYHSPHMQVIAEEYRTMIQILESGDPDSKNIAMLSSVTGEIVPREVLLSPDYWVLNLVSPVKFSDAIQNLFSKSAHRVRRKLDLSHRNYFHVNMLLEVGPHSALQRPIKEILDDYLGVTGKISYASLLIRENSAINTVLNAVGQIKCLGYPVNLERINNYGMKHRQAFMALPDLPAYIFDHSKKYWAESRLSARYRTHHQGKLDLLGKPVPDWNPMQQRWRNILGVSEMPWMEDHVINGSLIYPGAGMLVMAIEAANQISNSCDNVLGFELKDVSFPKPLNILQDFGGIETQLSINMAQESSKPLETWSEFRLFSYHQDLWSECCCGFIRVKYETNPAKFNQIKEDLEELRARQQVADSMTQLCERTIDPVLFYGMMGKSGLKFGPTFQRLMKGAYGKDDQAALTISLYQWPEQEYPQDHVIHPTSLDAIFHAAFVGLVKGGETGMPTMIPTFLRSLFISKTGLHFPENAEIEECSWKVVESSIATEFSGFALNSSRDKILVQFDDLKVTNIGDYQTDFASKNHPVTQRAYNIEHQPDPRFLNDELTMLYCQQPQQSNCTPFSTYVHMIGHKNPSLKILGISLEIEELASNMLHILSTYNDERELICTRYGSFCLTAQSQVLLDQAHENFQNYSYLKFLCLKIEDDPTKQGFNEGDYDIILASNKVQDNDIFLRNIRKIMKPDGELFLYGLNNFNFAEKEVPCDNGTSSLLSENGFTDPGFQLCASTQHPQSTVSIHRTIQQASEKLNDQPIYIISNPKSALQVQSSETLAGLLHSLGLRDVNIINLKKASNMEQIEKKCFVALIELDCPLLYSISREAFLMLQKFLLRAHNIVWVNPHGGLGTGKPEYGLMQGFSRVLRNEFSDLRLTTISFELQEKLSGRQLQSLVQVLITNHLATNTIDGDMEFTEINGALAIPRVTPAKQAMYEIERRSRPLQSGVTKVQDAPPLKLTMGTLGLLDSLHFIEDKSSSEQLLEDDEIEIQVKAIGMNFKDCLIALGQLSNTKLGQECAGIVTRAGTETEFAPGDRVVIVGAETFKTFVRGKANGAVKIPESMSFSTAAAVPAQFGTAWEVVHKLARLQTGESILIHSAASGTGQAAIQIAKLIGATIFATVGSQSKKQLLINEYLIPEENIFYSRDISFAKGIKRVTKGRGVVSRPAKTYVYLGNRVSLDLSYIVSSSPV